MHRYQDVDEIPNSGQFNTLSSGIISHHVTRPGGLNVFERTIEVRDDFKSATPYDRSEYSVIGSSGREK